MASDLIRLRSPFTGGIYVVPPDQPPAFVEELLKRGFTRADEPQTKSNTKSEKHHG